jgi:hypothetical protein
MPPQRAAKTKIHKSRLFSLAFHFSPFAIAVHVAGRCVSLTYRAKMSTVSMQNQNARPGHERKERYIRQRSDLIHINLLIVVASVAVLVKLHVVVNPFVAITARREQEVSIYLQTLARKRGIK